MSRATRKTRVVGKCSHHAQRASWMATQREGNSSVTSATVQKGKILMLPRRKSALSTWHSLRYHSTQGFLMMTSRTAARRSVKPRRGRQQGVSWEQASAAGRSPWHRRCEEQFRSAGAMRYPQAQVCKVIQALVSHPRRNPICLHVSMVANMPLSTIAMSMPTTTSPQSSQPA
jgi:hypothetical protein